MVRPSGRRGDADLGLVTDKTGRVEGRPIAASSRGVRGRHSTSDLPVIPTPLAPSFHYGTGEAGSSTQPPVVLFRSQPPLQPHLSHTPVSYEPYGSGHPPSPHRHRSRNKRPEVARDFPFIEVLILLYGSHWLGPYRFAGLTGSLGFNALELHAVATSRQISQSHQVRAVCYLQYILGSSLFSDKSGNIIPARLWPLLRDVSFVWMGSCLSCISVPESGSGFQG
ncbi:hypothetical protein M9H77_35551 [Catharanthus roseus]|uniref:Uncharacterized protein n=1 Tax=Catharanthus roseus TaxID=4058 RepID=A0ACB9ZQL2_CATRO|nr:hypothetical protein M9H77_35551 [Catharanthus roseus]